MLKRNLYLLNKKGAKTGTPICGAMLRFRNDFSRKFLSFLVASHAFDKIFPKLFKKFWKT